jgi:hypothetical protein
MQYPWRRPRAPEAGVASSTTSNYPNVGAEDRRREANQARTRQLNQWHHEDRHGERAAQRNTDRQLERF